MHKGLCIGVDLGGTQLRIRLYSDLQAPLQQSSLPEALLLHQELVRQREPEVLAQILADRIREILRKSQKGALKIPVGLAVAGMLADGEGTIANAPGYGWKEVAFATILQEKLGERFPVSTLNDAAAYCWAEHQLGIAKGKEDCLSFLVGTGVGAGIVANGQLLQGANYCAAEIGHVNVDASDTALICGCGMRGCLEAYVGGRALRRRVRRELSLGIRSDALAIKKADEVELSDIDRAAAGGDPYSLQLYSEIAPLFAQALSHAAALLNPSMIILGGGVLSRAPILCADILACFEVLICRASRRGLQISLGSIGESAGALGAALWACQQAQ